MAVIGAPVAHQVRLARVAELLLDILERIAETQDQIPLPAVERDGRWIDLVALACHQRKCTRTTECMDGVHAWKT